MSIRDRVNQEREKRNEELGQVINDICDLLEFYGVDEKELEEVFEPIRDSYGIFVEELDDEEDED